MRAFLAIEISEEAKHELIKIQKQLPDAKLKLVEPENLHLTLNFFGEIDDKKANKIKELLSEIKFQKFKGHLGKIGFFPNEKFIRVVWVSLEPNGRVKELHKEINKVLNIKEEDFESHITLARIKFIKNKEEFVKEVKKINVKTVEFDVDSFVLKKSTLTEKGPIYGTIKEFRLN